MLRTYVFIYMFSYVHAEEATKCNLSERKLTPFVHADVQPLISSSKPADLR